MPNSPAPIDLLREHRQAFVDEQREAFGRRETERVETLQKRIQQIDVTLRDWA